MISKFSKSNEIINSIQKVMNKRLTTPVYGTFLVSWFIVHWEFIFTIFFVSEDKIWNKTGLLKHVYLHQTFFNYRDLTFWFWQIVPFILTYFIIWKFPKWIAIPAFERDVEYKVEKRKAEISGQRKLEEESVKKLEVETEKAQKQKLIKEIDPSINWMREYNEFRTSIFFKEFRYIIDSIYKYNGDIVRRNAYGNENVFEIPKDILVYSHTNDLVVLDKLKEKMELTEKGKFFVKLFTSEENIDS